MRERAGAGELVLDLPEGARVADALDQLDELAGGLPLVMAVNREYAPRERVLGAGDELALIPRSAVGRRAPPHVRVTGEALQLDSLAARVRDPRAGAVVTFQGVTREVDALEYEAYAEMAAERIEEIVRAAIDSHGLCAAAAEHRVGVVPLSQPSVAVAASAPHRGEAFAGAREIIDRVKAEAPIWKLEVEGSTAALGGGHGALDVLAGRRYGANSPPPAPRGSGCGRGQGRPLGRRRGCRLGPELVYRLGGRSRCGTSAKSRLAGNVPLQAAGRRYRFCRRPSSRISGAS